MRHYQPNPAWFNKISMIKGLGLPSINKERYVLKSFNIGASNPVLLLKRWSVYQHFYTL